jgi:hypothetical protein
MLSERKERNEAHIMSPFMQNYKKCKLIQGYQCFPGDETLRCLP